MPLTLSVDRQRSLMTMWLDDTFNIVVSNFSSQVGATVPSQWCLYGRLKIVADLASLTALGRLFHSPITLELKKLFLNSWLFLFFNSLSVPVVALVCARGRSCLSPLIRCHKNLLTVCVIHHFVGLDHVYLGRRSRRLGSFSSTKRSSYDVGTV